MLALIRRERGDYQGLWAIPGGKVERGEHISDAARREVFEETGISSRFSNIAAIVSEHLHEDGGVANHFILFLCILTPEHKDIASGEEGACEWFTLQDCNEREDIVPSDRKMLSLLDIDGVQYAECTMRWDGKGYVLDAFEVR